MTVNTGRVDSLFAADAAPIDPGDESPSIMFSGDRKALFIVRFVEFGQCAKADLPQIGGCDSG